jgi:short-subunit dehydrogenase
VEKTALITGAAGGIGRELARIHAENGGSLVLVDRNRNDLLRLQEELQLRHTTPVHLIIKDLFLAAAPKEIYDELSDKKIPVHYLINNAGLGDFGNFAESDWKKQENIINLNVKTLTYLTRLFLPDMIENGYGKILNVASTAAFQPGPTMSVYFATKAYVLNFSEAINIEVRSKGITVTTLCPGSTDTGFHAAVLDNKPVKKRELQSARVVAEYGYAAMMKGKNVVVPGLKNKFMAFSVRFLPRLLVAKIAEAIQTRKHL